MEFNSLTLSLNQFIEAFSGGYDRIGSAVQGLLGAFVTIEVLLFGLWFAFGGEQVASALKKLLALGLWVWIVQNYSTLAKAFVTSMIEAGLMAGGRSGDHRLLLDPSAIAGHGLDATEMLVKRLEDVGTFDVVDAIIFGFAYIAIMSAFLLIALNVFLAVLEYYLVLALVGVLMPFGINRHTRFIAEKGINAVVSSGLKLMVLSFILAVIEPTLGQIRFKTEAISMNELWAVLLTAGACAFLSWHAPRMAAGLISSSPNLSGSQATATAAGLGASVASGVAGAAGFVVGAAKVGATKAAAALGRRETSATSGVPGSPGPSNGGSEPRRS